MLPPSKREPSYWRGRLFKNVFTYKGKRVEVSSWSVKIQLFGKRKTFSLSSRNRTQAADEACQIYENIIEHGWESAMQGRSGAVSRSKPRNGSKISSDLIVADVDYWRRRLIRRKYSEHSSPESDGELSVRIEHAHTSHYFPLGTCDETQAADKAMKVYQTVVNRGWANVNATFPRELSVVLRWQDNPLTWTYTTIHTRIQSTVQSPQSRVHSPETPDSGLKAGSRSPEYTIALIEPDAGIRIAMEACASGQAGFRCGISFASAAEALREIPRSPVSFVLANHDLPIEPGTASLDELQQIKPGLAVVFYSVFEDTDHLFKATPGGSGIYMLKRTPSLRLFEPIAEMTGPVTREKIASHIRDYFQRLAASLPSDPTSGKLAKLTPREHEVLALLSKGYLDKEIADSLRISIWTVHGHVKNIFEKLNVHSRSGAVVKYLQK
ncbi:MAG: response regulator transcription factor [Verrucomicrobia bacterium]|nr:response regulator transcription factor [Verrucomicrobiota bacterium]